MLSWGEVYIQAGILSLDLLRAEPYMLDGDGPGQREGRFCLLKQHKAGGHGSLAELWCPAARVGAGSWRLGWRDRYIAISPFCQLGTHRSFATRQPCLRKRCSMPPPPAPLTWRKVRRDNPWGRWNRGVQASSLPPQPKCCRTFLVATLTQI